MIPIHQDQFGAPNSGEPLGNCFPACLASLMHLPLAAVPHFYENMVDPTVPQDEKTWWGIADWCALRGWGILAWNCPLNEFMHRSLSGGLLIGSGESPRFPGTMHAVVGRFEGKRWVTLHDPHPSGDGILGEPSMVELLFRLEN